MLYFPSFAFVGSSISLIPLKTVREDVVLEEKG